MIWKKSKLWKEDACIETQIELVCECVFAYKDVEELEDAFVSEDVEDVPWRRVDDRQPVDLILQQGVDGFKQTERTTKLVISILTWGL